MTFLCKIPKEQVLQHELLCLVTWVDIGVTFPLTPIEMHQSAAAKTLLQCYSVKN